MGLTWTPTVLHPLSPKDQVGSSLEESGNTARDGAKNNPESIIRLSKVGNEKTNIDNAVFEEPVEAGFGFVF